MIRNNTNNHDDSKNNFDDLNELAVEVAANGYDRHHEKFAELLKKSEKYCRNIYRQLWQPTAQNSNRLDDAVQQTLINVVEKFNQYKPSMPYKPWFAQIAIRAGIDNFRRESRHTRITNFSVISGEHRASEFEDSLPASLKPIEHFDDANIAQDLVLRFMRTLKPEKQRLFQLVNVDNITYATAAEEFGISVGTIKSRMHNLNKLFIAFCQDQPNATIIEDFGYDANDHRINRNKDK